MADHSTNENRQAIMLEHMPQQLHVWRQDDDWTGIVDRKERRKLQNRQNQRKWRQRTRASRSSGSPTDTAPSVAETALTADPASLHNSTSTPVAIHSQPDKNEELFCSSAPPHALEYLRRLEATMRQHYLSSSPRIEHLLGLTRLNVHRAIEENIRAIGMTPEWTCYDDGISIFNLTPAAPSWDIEKIPPSLRPTPIQLNTPHHPWLDFFPFPRMRNTLIAASELELFDDEELCHDLMAFWDTRNTQATLVVWGDSWRPENWEVTERFVAKWGWLLGGCHELLVSTNYWRRKRGEKGFVWRDVLN